MSAQTRATIAPTVRQAIRINAVTAVFEHCVASHATVSSKAIVCPAPCRAQGTCATTRRTHRANVANHRPTALIELDLLNDRLVDAHKSAPYPGVTHAVLRSPVADPRQASNLSGNGVFATQPC